MCLVQTKTDIDEITAQIAQIDLVKQDPRCLIYEHFSMVKNKVDLRNAILSVTAGQQFEEIYAEVIEEVEQAERKCEETISGVDGIARLQKTEEERLKEEFSLLVKNSKNGDVKKDALNIQNQFRILLDNYKDHLFISKIFDFEFDEVETNFGSFVSMSKHEFPFFDSIILNDESKTCLIKLCEFKTSQKWRLVYRGSVHGFYGGSFHLRCNRVARSITIIQTSDNNVFGGYTDAAWSRTPGYVRDENAFLFSLVNPSSKPVKIKCSDPDHAIFNKAKRGPIFGCGQSSGKRGHDICIKNGSNKLENFKPGKFSYSRLGGSYLHPTSSSSFFLTGTGGFLTKEIEVYCKI